MKSEIQYSDEPMEFTVIDDFLPSPEELRKGLKKVTVTMEVDALTEQVFRNEAGGDASNSHRMMSKLLDLYAAKHTSKH